MTRLVLQGLDNDVVEPEKHLADRCAEELLLVPHVLTKERLGDLRPGGGGLSLGCRMGGEEVAVVVCEM